ncbi:MAG: FHA domain-containing protein [Kiritimatiellia bacterium]
MMIHIDFPVGPEHNRGHSFRQERLRFGSSPENEVCIAGEGVLPLHAVIELREDQGTLLPGESGGAIRVNGRPVETACLLEPGDRIELAGKAFVYKLIPYPEPVKYRRVAVLEWITLGLLIGGGLFQLYFLVVPSWSFRGEIDEALLRATPTPTPTPSVEEPKPEIPVQEGPRLIPTPVPTSEPTPIPPPTPTPLPSSEGLNPPDLTREAAAFARRGDDLQAERFLQQAISLDPEYLPAKMELAKMKGRQSLFDQSIALWTEIAGQAESGSPEAMEARMELRLMRRRKELLEKAPEPPRQMPTPRAMPDTPGPRFPDPPKKVREQPSQVLIEEVRMERYVESPRYDELRMIHYQLHHQEGTPAVAAGEMRVRVSFFEQEGERVKLAQIPEPQILQRIPEGLSSGQKIEDLSAAYEVPRGRKSDNRSYYGAVIQVFIGDKEIHRSADPAFLLDYIR